MMTLPTGGFARWILSDRDCLRIRVAMRRHFLTRSETRDEIDIIGAAANNFELSIAIVAAPAGGRGSGGSLGMLLFRPIRWASNSRG